MYGDVARADGFTVLLPALAAQIEHVSAGAPFSAIVDDTVLSATKYFCGFRHFPGRTQRFAHPV